jgi:hypothetical protein
VSSDWEQLLVLISGGVERAGEAGLRASLELVEGEPFSDSTAGQWHWAGDWRDEIVSTVTRIGVALTDMALARGDVELARWATAKAMLVVPQAECLLQAERLLMAQLRTEHMAGDQRRVGHMAVQIVRKAKQSGTPLSDEMVALLQRVTDTRTAVGDAPQAICGAEFSRS